MRQLAALGGNIVLLSLGMGEENLIVLRPKRKRKKPTQKKAFGK